MNGTKGEGCVGIEVFRNMVKTTNGQYEAFSDIKKSNSTTKYSQKNHA